MIGKCARNGEGKIRKTVHEAKKNWQNGVHRSGLNINEAWLNTEDSGASPCSTSTILRVLDTLTSAMRNVTDSCLC